MNQKIIVMALALMVAIPILLGYALAFEDHDHAGWDSGDRENITDMVGTTTIRYFVHNTGPANNGSLTYRYTVTEGGHTFDWSEISNASWKRVISAGYSNDVSTSQPVYYYQDDIVNIPASSYTVYAADGILNEDNWPAGLSNSNIRIEGTQLETLTFTPAQGDPWTSDLFYGTSDNIRTLFDNQTPANGKYRDFSYPLQQMSLPRYLDVTDFQVSGPAGMTYKIIVNEIASFNIGTLFPDYHGSMTFMLDRGEALLYRVYDDVGNTQPTLYTILNPYDAPYLINEIKLDDGTINLTSADVNISVGTNIAQIGIASFIDETVYLKHSSNQFADVSAGWSQNSYYNGSQYEHVEGIWHNGHINQKVYMAMYVPVGRSVQIDPLPYNEYYEDTAFIISTNNSGVSYVNGYIDGHNYASKALGQYNGRLWLEFDGAEHVINVSGVVSTSSYGYLPEYGKTPQTSNTITVNEPMMNNIDDISFRELNGIGNIVYRVDMTYTYSGYYQGISNSVLDPSKYWPNKSVSFKLSSIMDYGDRITFAGTNFPVNDGKIVVNGKDMPLRDAIFMCTYNEDEGRWYNTINGQSIDTDTGLSASTIYLRGNWLMTIYKYDLIPTTWTSHDWQPGVFAFNGADNSFALLGLAGSAAVFVALALYGRHSGAKVGTLLLICGFAGLIFLCMIV